MNKNLIILVAGCLVLGATAIFTDSGIQQNLGLNSKNNISRTTPAKKSPTVNRSTSEIETVKITRVVDGDTVELEDGRKVRLLNMDTPETVKPATPVMCYGKEASEYSKKSLTGKIVQLVPDKEANDRYGRALRLVFLQGKDISKVEESFNAELVRGGYAGVKVYRPNVTFEKPLLSIQEEAKFKKAGMWGACPNPLKE